MVGLRRELSHRELPDGKLPAPAIIVSFGVLPTGDSGDGVTVQQESIPAESREAEIPRITFTIRNTSLGPVTGGRAVAIFQLFYSSRGRSVFIQIDENLALLVILVCRSAAGDLSATNRCGFLARFSIKSTS